MEAVSSLSSSSLISKTVTKLSKIWRWCPPKKVYCQSSGTKSGNVSSVVTERSSMLSSETLGSLVLTPNTEIKVKDLVPYGQPRHDDGIGITMFLRGKAFLITGATGFLGKVLIEKILRTAPVLGNVCEANLGIDQDTANMMAKEVDVIVNSAANTTFDERLLLQINIWSCVHIYMSIFSFSCQVASSAVNPLVFKDLARMLFDHFNRSPYIDSKGRPIHVPKMSLLGSMEDLSSHLWRDAINRSGLTDVSDPNGKLSRKLENICRKSVEQAKYLANIYEPYTFYGGRFDNSNTQRLMECMSKEERWQFGFDVESIDWKDYISNVHIPGLRKHVMKGRGSCT